MSNDSPFNRESSFSQQLAYGRRSPTLIKRPSYSQFPLPPGAPPWDENPRPPQHHLSRRRTMEDRTGKAQNGRLSPYTLSVAAEFSLKRANRQLVAMGETLENVKSELSSPTSPVAPVPFRTHSRSNSEPMGPITPTVPRSADGYSTSGDMLGDMRRLAAELRTLRESIDPARRGSGSSVASTSRGSTPLTSPRFLSRVREDSVETPRTSPRHSRNSSSPGLRTLHEDAPVIEVQTMRGSAIGQPSAVVRIFRSKPREQYGELYPPRTHSRSMSESNGIRFRQFDYTDHEAYRSPRIREELYSPTWRPASRADSELSVISEGSYHTAVDSHLEVEADLNGQASDASDHISDTATIGRPVTPVTQVRSIGINTEDVLPVETVPPQPLHKRPSRAALLSNIRGCQDGIVIARLHSAIDKLAVQLASTPIQNSSNDSELRQKLQAALNLLEQE
jgi:hypothetical protein